ncbi:MAG: dipeptide/oligopeptide/nickel ABC transporter permease/ATP-binding protein [Actinomycetota bacterium]|nr:dipeptide/oligopeptide/nickel ABC transporter permease/ATP-binding protein [Actinomycetota bacterium]
MSDALPAAEQTVAPRSEAPAGRPLRALARRPAAAAGALGVVLIVAVAIFAPLVAPHDPAAQDLTVVLAPPAWEEGGSMAHPLGTDALGRDVASRLAFGARNSLVISVAAMLIGSTLGLAAGLLAGFFRGRVDALLMRLGDVQLAFPFILLAIAILGLVSDRTLLLLIVVLGIPGWIVYARVVRSRVLAEREKEYVQAAKALGAGSFRRLFRYVLPSAWQVVPVIAMLDVGFLVIMESTLSFLGLGLPPPAASWGSMLAEGRQNMVISTWLPILPGLAIVATVLSINLLADGLADVLDPKLAKGTFRRMVMRAPAPRQELPEAEPPLLRVRDLHVEFPLRHRVVRAVRGLSFDLQRGQTLGIVGESGSGKSVTALSIIQLLDSPGRVTRGQILFDGQDLARTSDRRMAALRGRRIGMIFQNPAASLNPVLSVGFQMQETIRRHGLEAGQEAESVARQALRSAGIGDPDRVLRQHPFQLSGGMNQRVMIAMAMTARPDLLIADEPTTALDVTTQAQILEQLKEVTRRQDTSLILITHDIALVAEYADVVLVMYAGQAAEVGPVQEVVERPRHPYTRALLESVPRADLPAGSRLDAIAGELPDPTKAPAGCPFAPRCPEVMDICWEADPDQFEVGPEHRAACFLWSPERAKVGAE